MVTPSAMAEIDQNRGDEAQSDNEDEDMDESGEDSYRQSNVIDRTSDHEIAYSCVTESVYFVPQQNKNS